MNTAVEAVRFYPWSTILLSESGDTSLVVRKGRFYEKIVSPFVSNPNKQSISSWPLFFLSRGQLNLQFTLRQADHVRLCSMMADDAGWAGLSGCFSPAVRWASSCSKASLMVVTSSIANLASWIGSSRGGSKMLHYNSPALYFLITETISSTYFSFL